MWIVRFLVPQPAVPKRFARFLFPQFAVHIRLARFLCLNQLVSKRVVRFFIPQSMVPVRVYGILPSTIFYRVAVMDLWFFGITSAQVQGSHYGVRDKTRPNPGFALLFSGFLSS
jgi:hypothetical protein